MQVCASTLVGRRRHLRELERFARCARAGSGRSVCIIGEPGAGKTRLLAEARTIAEHLNVRVLRGRSSKIGPSVPYRPLTEALTSLFRPGDTPPDGSKLGPYRTVLGRIIPDWREDTRTDTSPVVLAEAVLRMLSLAGKDNGCMLVLDDLHQADPETLAVVEYLMDNVESQPVTLILASRLDDSYAVELVRAATQRKTCDVLELGPLDRESTRALIASCLDIEPPGVPTEVVDRLYAASGGTPLLVEELLRPMVEDGALVSLGGRWQVTGALCPAVPSTLMRTLTDRVNQVSPEVHELLAVAALLGQRFPLDVLQHAAGVGYAQLVTRLYAATEAQLVIADESSPDWYTFRYPLIAEVILAQLGPKNRVSLARLAANGIEEVHPNLDGEWCELVAALRMEFGDRVGAARLLLTAGQRTLAGGAAESAAALLERGLELVANTDEVELRTDILDNLVPVLGEKGDFDRAFQLQPLIDQLPDQAVPRLRQVELHTKMATVALHAGCWETGIEQVDKARALLGQDATNEESAPIDVIAARLAISVPSPTGARLAEELVTRAAPAAERVNLISVACQAWELRGVLLRERDPDEATVCFGRARRLAEQHQLPIERISALIRLGGNEWLLTGGTALLEEASRAASQLGDVIVGYSADAALALQLVLSGEFAAAGEQLEQCWSVVSRFKLKPLACYVLMARATLAAHRGDRRQMQRELVTFTRWGGEQSPEVALAYGLARAFCALLEDNVPRARRELATMVAKRRQRTATFHLSGEHGLQQLLCAVAGELSWAQYDEVMSAAAVKMRWNRQFMTLTKAVLLGRAGRVAEIPEVMAEAADAGRIYPVAWHLGLRLIAPAAYADRWGDPITWLREAEDYFHGISANAVSSACRAQLRRLGAPVHQRRRDTGRVPAELRKLGITAREHEVLELLARRLSNKELADELHISPRTVEKHVANLISKTDQPNRSALNRLAEQLSTCDDARD